MKKRINLVTPEGRFLEELVIEHDAEFVLYRGRLFQLLSGTSDKFVERSYLEIG